MLKPYRVIHKFYYAVKPNPNYVPPASVAKPRVTVCSMKLADLRDWVKTRAQIRDVAYCYDRISERHYIYCYRKPDDNPIWIMMQPEFLEEYFKTESKGEDTMMGTINCTYETPCGWCTKWDKKCDRNIGCNSPSVQVQKSDAQEIMDYINAGKLPPLK